MATKKASALNFDKVLGDILLEYGDEATRLCNEAVPKIAKKTVAELKKTSPTGTRGKYAKSWTSQNTKNRNGSEAVIYSNEEYRLTHLLENGHALRNGGRAKAIPHIAPAEEKAKKELIEEIEKGIGKL